MAELGSPSCPMTLEQLCTSFIKENLHPTVEVLCGLNQQVVGDLAVSLPPSELMELEECFGKDAFEMAWKHQCEKHPYLVRDFKSRSHSFDTSAFDMAVRSYRDLWLKFYMSKHLLCFFDSGDCIHSKNFRTMFFGEEGHKKKDHLSAWTLENFYSHMVKVAGEVKEVSIRCSRLRELCQYPRVIGAFQKNLLSFTVDHLNDEGVIQCLEVIQQLLSRGQLKQLKLINTNLSQVHWDLVFFVCSGLFDCKLCGQRFAAGMKEAADMVARAFQSAFSSSPVSRSDPVSSSNPVSNPVSSSSLETHPSSSPPTQNSFSNLCSQLSSPVMDALNSLGYSGLAEYSFNEKSCASKCAGELACDNDDILDDVQGRDSQEVPGVCGYCFRLKSSHLDVCVEGNRDTLCQKERKCHDSSMCHLPVKTEVQGSSNNTLLSGRDLTKIPGDSRSNNAYTETIVARLNSDGETDTPDEDERIDENNSTDEANLNKLAGTSVKNVPGKELADDMDLMNEALMSVSTDAADNSVTGLKGFRERKAGVCHDTTFRRLRAELSQYHTDQTHHSQGVEALYLLPAGPSRRSVTSQPDILPALACSPAGWHSLATLHLTLMATMDFSYLSKALLEKIQGGSLKDLCLKIMTDFSDENTFRVLENEGSSEDGHSENRMAAKAESMCYLEQFFWKTLQTLAHSGAGQHHVGPMQHLQIEAPSTVFKDESVHFSSKEAFHGLQRLDLRNVGFASEAVFSQLVQFIRQDAALCHLSVVGHKLDSPCVDLLLGALCSKPAGSLKHLDLTQSLSGLNDSQWKMVCQLLNRHSTLAFLSLSQCGITDEQMRSEEFVTGVRQHKDSRSLTLDLSYNSGIYRLADFLSAVVCPDSSLKDLRIQGCILTRQEAEKMRDRLLPQFADQLPLLSNIEVGIVSARRDDIVLPILHQICKHVSVLRLGCMAEYFAQM